MVWRIGVERAVCAKTGTRIRIMHILFIHQNFPAQFGHVAARLIETGSFECTFLSEAPAGEVSGIRRIEYHPRHFTREATHFAARTFENQLWRAEAIADALAERPDIRPDLVVGHSGLGPTLFLRELCGCPIINYFEYYYHERNSDVDFRPEYPASLADIRRVRARNAMLLVDLQNCAAGYCPTDWQRSRFPREYQYKLRTIFDGIDTQFWKPAEDRARRPKFVINEREISPDTKIVTYVTRGFESLRGFDIFMRVAKRLCEERDDVVFICVGSDRVCYGSDLAHIQEKSFLKHVLAQDDYDLVRISFPGHIPPHEVLRILQASDLHVYFTAPFVLSWSMLNAMACGCTVLASDTPPVREMIRHGENGLLADFYDVDKFVELANQVIDNPPGYRHLGVAARNTIEQNYSLDVVFPKLCEFYQGVARA